VERLGKERSLRKTYVRKMREAKKMPLLRESPLRIRRQKVGLGSMRGGYQPQNWRIISRRGEDKS